MAHVLIGHAEALPAAEVIFSLLSGGHRITAFCRSADIPLARLPVELVEIPEVETDVAGAIAALETRIAAIAPDVILPLDDTGLWLVDHAETGGASVASPGQQAIKVALSKDLQIAAARAAGIRTPATVVWDGQPMDAPDLVLPAIAKPALAVSRNGDRLAKADVVYLGDSDEAQRFFSSGSDVDQPFLVQPLLGGTGTGVFGFCDNAGTVHNWSAHERIRMMNPHGSGASCCRSTEPDPALTAPVEAFLTSIGWRGPFMVEGLRDAEGVTWFMELNGRMWGSMALARRQGFEYPLWAVEQALSESFVPPQITGTPGLEVRHLGRDLLHLAFVARGPKSAFHKAGWPSLLQSAGAVIRPSSPGRFYNHDPAHQRYFLRDAIWTVRKALKR